VLETIPKIGDELRARFIDLLCEVFIMLQRKPKKGDIIKYDGPGGIRYFTVTRVEEQIAHMEDDQGEFNTFIWKWHKGNLNRLHSIATCGDCKYFTGEECNGFEYEGNEMYFDDDACVDFLPKTGV